MKSRCRNVQETSLMTDWVIREHFSILADQLDALPFNSTRATRAKANLQALTLDVSAARQLADRFLAESDSVGETAAAVLLAMEIRESELVVKTLASALDDAEKWEGIRRGMRLAVLGPVADYLQQRLAVSQSLCRTTLLDILLFHRRPVAFDPARLAPNADDELRLMAISSLARSDDSRYRSWVAQTVQTSDASIPVEALRAAARTGFAPLAMCRAKSVSHQPCMNSVRFLGVIGDESDHGLLRQLAAREPTSSAAIDAMGSLGATELLPDIVSAVSDPATSQAAVRALERISGTSVPRGDPPKPPAHLTEEELDFWHQPGEPLPDTVQQWWQRNQWSFESGKRYQAGICVSEDPLGSAFDSLPDNVRRDVYLRQRALDLDNTPDWELETWPEYQRTPNWATSSTPS